MKKVILFTVISLLFILSFGLISGCTKDSPAEKLSKKVSDSISDKVTGLVTKDCSANICMLDGTEYFCPQDIEKCREEFDFCSKIACYDKTEKSTKESETDIKTTTKTGSKTSTLGAYTSDTQSDNYCSKEYNDCTTSGGEQIVCHGSFDDCSNAFESCHCGTSDSTNYSYSSDSTLDFKSDSQKKLAEQGTCETGVYICKKTSLSMTGEPTTSTVECKSSYSDCCIRYDECTCGQKTGWFAKKETVKLCKWNSIQVPCDRIVKDPADCDEKKNLCDKGNGILITCDGSFSFCSKRYDTLCICGNEPW